LCANNRVTVVGRRLIPGGIAQTVMAAFTVLRATWREDGSEFGAVWDPVSGEEIPLLCVPGCGFCLPRTLLGFWICIHNPFRLSLCVFL
jgi:hypothetical protein